MIVIPHIPEDVTRAPVQRAFHLGNSTIRKLSAFGAQVPVFVEAYIRSWRPYKDAWNYEDGMIWLGALDLYEATGDASLLDFVRTEAERRITPEGVMTTFESEEYNIDNIHAGRVLPRLYALTGDERYRRAMDRQFSQLLTHPRTQSGNYWHKQIYPWQVWLDGLYMAQPFQTAYARAAGQPDLFADTVRQFLAVEANLKAGSGLYHHGWDESRAERWADPVTGRSPCVWSRAMGWWVMALADVCEAAEGLDGRGDIAHLLTDSLDALRRVRKPGGLWYQVADQGSREGNYEEASASLMIAYALMKAMRLGVTDTAAEGLSALRLVCDRFVTPSALEGICGVAGLGNTPYRDGSYAYYLSEKITPNDPKGVGALMMALSEGSRLP
ncbi:glycoside hydrolase family 88/105 protein [Asticcacaulis sp.]|uniref:glycoside hydrolase family 88/105 protein n=1 Tax=Asticcacaulis sp. TaxID=1872648 RepID=UPI002C05BDB5|nr:glycoside hydrolase family 88 protein [Asticcacaulis sp.]HTM82309.1 glycoside hydrolase family 88 protein [Asticcacaulis sp.]